jgi:protein-tyrosine phosphatase
MALRPLPLPEPLAGRLWLAPMPGRLEPLARFLAEAKHAALTEVVCLAGLDEVEALSPDYHAAITKGALPFGWRHLPMRNFGLADDEAAWDRAVRAITQDVRDGGSILLHCAAGIGRTGTVAACVLKCLGLPEREALARVRAAGSNPETALQSGRIARF